MRQSYKRRQSGTILLRHRVVDNSMLSILSLLELGLLTGQVYRYIGGKMWLSSVRSEMDCWTLGQKDLVVSQPLQTDRHSNTGYQFRHDLRQRCTQQTDYRSNSQHLSVKNYADRRVCLLCATPEQHFRWPIIRCRRSAYMEWAAVQSTRHRTIAGYFQRTFEYLLILYRVLRPRRICDIYDFFAPHINVLTYLLTYFTNRVKHTQYFI